MYKIGKFSKLTKTTIKTLRYYEKESLLKPIFIDNNGYRYYDNNQILDLVKIVSLRQIGLSIKEIKEIFKGKNLKKFLEKRKLIVLEELETNNYQLSKIKYLLEEENMKYEVIEKVLPSCTVYYKEGIIDDFSNMTDFIVGSAEECRKVNPNIKCDPLDYCFVNYLDGAYKPKNIKIRYSQAVLEKGVETDNIKFADLKPIEAVCIYHKGSYEGLRDAYSFIMKYISENNYEIIDSPREVYIDGMWNKEDVNDWLTEIQVPVNKNSRN